MTAINIVAKRPTYGATSSDDQIPSRASGATNGARSRTENVVTRWSAPDAGRRQEIRLPTPAESLCQRDDLMSFSRKMQVYGREALSKDYGAANAAILGGMAGLGIANGGYMVLLKTLGAKGSSLPVVGFMALTAFSMILSGASKTYTSHQRDNQDLFLAGHAEDDITAAQYCKYFVRCNFATASANAVLWAAAAGYAAKLLSANTVLAISVVSKSAEACLKGVELGYWNCIKTHLGDSDSQRYQRDLNRTIVGIESITQAVAFNAATIGSYVATVGSGEEAAMMSKAMASLAVGSAVILLSASYFVHLEKTLDRQTLPV